jgi:hypothetical protein
MKKFTLKISIPENLKDFNSAEEWALSESLFIWSFYSYFSNKQLNAKKYVND